MTEYQLRQITNLLSDIKNNINNANKILDKDYEKNFENEKAKLIKQKPVVRTLTVADNHFDSSNWTDVEKFLTQLIELQMVSEFNLPK